MTQQLTGNTPGRNDPCPCGSGLKHKKCHGDPVKIDMVNHAANVAMNHLIQCERVKKGLICKHGVAKSEKCVDCSGAVELDIN